MLLKHFYLNPIVAFGRDFEEGDLNDLDEFGSLIHASLADLFPIDKKPDALIVYIKDPPYKSSINS
jgi:hypothetical protein